MLETVDQRMFSGDPITVVEVCRTKVDVWAVVLEQVPDDDQQGMTNCDSGLVPSTATKQAAVLRG